MDDSDIVLTLNNCQTYYRRAVGFCRRHNCYVTAAQLKGYHACLKKDCKYLKRFEDRQFWIERRKKKELKRRLKYGN